MIKKSLFGLFLLITTLCCFSSCDEDPYIAPYDPYQVAMENLCTPIWYDRYITVDNLDCLQELEFNYDHTGYDYRTYYYPNGATRTEDIPFTWDWDKGYTDALYIDYLDREGVWLEDIVFGRNTMTCIYDGLDEPVVFKASY